MDIRDYTASYDGRPGKADTNAKSKLKAKKKVWGREVAAYDYCNADGKLIYQSVRYAEPKNFFQRKPNGKGGWNYKNVFKGEGSVTRVLYRLPELLKFPDAPVFIAEGEKDTDRVRSLDLNPIATTVAGQYWTSDLADMLKGRDIFILEDNDQAGREKSLDVAQLLFGKAKSIRIVALPGLPEKGDVSDWLDADPARKSADLVAECLNAPLWVSAGDTQDHGDKRKTAGMGVNLDDFHAFMPSHTYIFVPTREMWPASSVNSRVPAVKVLKKDGAPVKDENGNDKYIKANNWLDAHRAVEQMTWAPGLPLTIADRLISEGDGLSATA